MEIKRKGEGRKASEFTSFRGKIVNRAMIGDCYILDELPELKKATTGAVPVLIVWESSGSKFATMQMVFQDDLLYEPDVKPDGICVEARLFIPQQKIYVLFNNHKNYQYGIYKRRVQEVMGIR